MADKQLGKSLSSFAPYFLVVALSFLIYQLYIVQNSFSALYTIAITTITRNQVTGSLWPLVQLSSEVSGEVGLLLRFVDASLLVFFAWFFLRTKELSFPLLRKAVLLEAVYFLFYLPFVVYLLANPYNLSSFVGAGISYALQIALVAPSLLIVYVNLKKVESGLDKNHVVRWFAVAFCCYVFSLWVKHFMFAIYAVGINFTEPVLAVGSVNSIATLLIAAVGSLIIFFPVLGGKRISFNLRAVGGVLICLGVYFVIFDVISLVNVDCSRFLSLTEWWGVALPVLGIGLVLHGDFVASRQSD